MADNVTNRLSLFLSTLPPDLCLSQEQAQILVDHLQIVFDENFFLGTVVYSPNTPGPENQDKLWIRTGMDFGIFFYDIDTGTWQQVYPLVLPDQITAKEICYTLEIPAATNAVPITFELFGGNDLFIEVSAILILQSAFKPIKFKEAKS